MATKSQTAKAAPKATKTTVTAAGKTKTTPAKKPATKPAGKPNETGRIVACIIGFIAAVALVVIGVIALANCINNKVDPDMVVVDGTGEKVATEYVEFKDNGFRVKIPKDWKEVDAAALGSTDASQMVLAAYTSKDETISFIIGTVKDTKVTNSQIKTYADTMKATFALTGTVVDSTISTKDEHDIAEMRVTVTSQGTKIAEDITVFSQNDKANMFVATYADKDSSRWSPVSDFITDSIEFLK